MTAGKTISTANPGRRWRARWIWHEADNPAGSLFFNYTTWASANGIPGELPENDYDNDGLSNLMEYALGLDPKVSNPLTYNFDDNTITFPKGSDAINNGDVTYIIETATDLVAGDWNSSVTHTPPDASPTIQYSFPSDQPKGFARLRIILSAP
ncbi:MAG: hypothetical protein FJ395_17500 [Verrucomicrobia bacterium]|nr:hypothetical protein [Verrucomicrobiota bacterium]